MVGIVEQASEDLDDRRSQHSVSTVATTTSLASRIAALNCDFGDKLLEGDESQIAAGKDGDAPEEAADAVGPLPSELAAPSNGGAAGGAGGGGAAGDGGLEDALRQLAGREPPLQVCSRLFVGRSHPPIALKRLSMMQVEDFRQHGYAVIDGLVPREAAARLKAEALRLAARGKFAPAASGNGALRTSIEASSRIDGGAAPAGIGGRSPASAASGAPAAAAHPVPSRVPQARQPGPHKRQQHHLPQQQQQQQQQGARPGEQRLPLQLGAPPADTAPFAALLAALQEVQDDLHEFMRLRQRGGADYALALLPAGGASVPRRRDALPDDGCGYLTHAAAAAAAAGAGDGGGGAGAGAAVAAAASPTPAAAAAAAVAADPSLLRRVSILVFLNPIWERDGGGCLRLWPPQRQSMLQQGGGGGGGGGAPTPAGAGGGAVSGRRSPTSSDAGTTFSEGGASECSSSLRLHYHLGSTTSSVVAEAASAVADPADAASLDGRLSLADSDVEAGARCCGFEWVEAEDGMALDVAPVAGRAVLMLAGAVDHALLAPAAGAGDIVFARAWCS